MALFDNGDPEEFLLFIHNFNMTLAASGMLESVSKIQYLRTLLHGETLHQFETFYDEVGSDIPEKLKYIVLGLGTYFFLLICHQRKKALCVAE